VRTKIAVLFFCALLLIRCHREAISNTCFIIRAPEFLALDFHKNAFSFNVLFTFCDISECHQNDTEMYRSNLQPLKVNDGYGCVVFSLK